MYKIVIVEDEKSVADGLKEMLQTYAAERELDLRIEEFESGDSFLQSGCSDYDIVLLDINMPGNNGIQVAKEIRAKGDNPDAVIIFCTNYPQYAISGYEVSALGYLIKPVTKLSLEHNLDKALKFLWRKQQLKLLIKSKDGQLVVRASDIVYIEVGRHNLYFHIMTAEGIKSIRTRGTMREMYDALKEMNFAKCSACYLINMNYITAINKSKIECAGGVVLFISRKSQKEFMTHFMKYIDEQGGVNV